MHLRGTFIHQLLSLLIACLFLALPATAQIASGPAAPALDASFCPGGLPGTNAPAWSGELPAWGGTSRPLVRVTLPAPAVCNDGSPAVIYVRPAPATLPNGQANPLLAAWQIHLKGGGSCRSFAECQKRFCMAPGKQTNKPGLMSSLGYPAAIEGTGMFADRPKNMFAMANQVLAAYCSSDGWIGNAPAGAAISIDPADNPATVSRIAFMGEEIVNAMLDALDSGLNIRTGEDGGAYKMPRLSDARYLIVSGDSAGASGARSHLDRIAARYPEAITVAVLDAGASIDMQDGRIDYTLLAATPSYAQMMDLRARQARSFQGVRNTALDASCVAATKAPRADCFDNYLVQRDYITTPTLQRTSLADVTAMAGVGGMLPAPVGVTLRQLSRDGLAAATAARANLSGLGPNCTRHITLRNNRQFARMEVLAGGTPLWREVRDWVQGCFKGACPKVVELANPANPAASTCP